MPRAVLVLSPFLDALELAGRPLADHVAATLAQAGASFTADPAGPHVVVDARYATLSVKTLTALIETLNRKGGSLHTPEGVLMASVHPTVDPAVPPAEWLRPVVGEALRAKAEESIAVEDCWELTAAEKVIMTRRLRRMAEQGVRVIDPQRVWVGPFATAERGAVLWPEVVLRGQTHIARGAEIRPGCWLEDTEVGVDALIKPHSVCTGARIGDGCAVGPMAHLRPGTVLESASKVGNFVEVKKTTLGRGAKASHLTYLGDAVIGPEANIGAGTITCNYDGFGKHPTHIGAGAFIGSNTALVAPVAIGEGAIIGAGSTISRDIPDRALAVERATTRVLEGKAPAIAERNRRKAEAAKRGKDG